MSRGLFKRAVMQSGATLAPAWHVLFQSDASSLGYVFATNLNCSLNSDSELVKCLQNKSVEEIADVANNGSTWMPTLDPTFLPQTPLEILQSGDFNKEIQVIIGTNADEGLLVLNSAIEDPTQFDQCRENFDLCGPSSLYYKQGGEITEEDIENARK